MNLLSLAEKTLGAIISFAVCNVDFVNEAPSLSEYKASIREGPAITAIHI